MKTYEKITDATDDILGRERTRPEVETGVVTVKDKGVKCLDLVFCKYYNKDGNQNKFNGDFSKWTRTIVKGSVADRSDALENAYLTGHEFDIIVGGEFESEQLVTKPVRTRVAANRYVVKTMDVLEKSKHTVAHAGRFVITNVIEKPTETVYIAEKVK